MIWVRRLSNGPLIKSIHFPHPFHLHEFVFAFHRHGFTELSSSVDIYRPGYEEMTQREVSTPPSGKDRTRNPLKLLRLAVSW